MPIIIANWKMHFSHRAAFEFCQKLPESTYSKNLVICPPALYLTYLAQNFKNIAFGAQNVSIQKDFGAYTGEYCASMLEDSGIIYSIVGHSGRRALFFETNEIVKQKALSCLDSEVTPIICIGEPLTARQNDLHLSFIKQQLIESLPITNKPLILAYEPVWSINTDVLPSLDQLSEAMNFIYLLLAELSVAKNVLLVYGGWVNQDNIEKILSIKNVGGALIGRASLDSTNLIEMLSSAMGGKI